MIIGNCLSALIGESDSEDVYAAISVVYPEGAICTATNGTKTLTSLDTSGEAIFAIPEPTSTPETWTVTVTNGTDSRNKTVSIATYGQVETVLIDFVPLIVNNATWAQISDISKAGTGDNYWDIGDCKKVHLQGNVGARLSLNTDLYVFILDFNHPINKTTADNNIIWGGFKTALTNGVDVALSEGVMSNLTDGTKQFNMNHWGNYNYGGWKGCDLRYDILGATSTPPSGYGSSPSLSRAGYDATAATISTPISNTLMAALPSDFRSILRLWNRYVDYIGNSSNSDANCSTATVDAISLLAEYEVFGSRTYANMYEQNHQKQMTYYTNGNSKIKYAHYYITIANSWLNSSPSASNNASFCLVTGAGESNSGMVYYNSPLAPAFKT